MPRSRLMPRELAAALLMTLVAVLTPGAPPVSAAPIQAPATIGEGSAPDLRQFRDPPAEARPRVWWHWMNGNISRAGIAKDLAWMAEVGIGGLQNFDVNIETPQVVRKRLAYMDPAWRDAFGFAVREADRLGLEMGISASPGWSETGGPWVPPQDGMKKLVWSETLVRGGKRTRMALDAPPATTGPFQDLPFVEAIAAYAGKRAEISEADGRIAVLAFPVAARLLPAPTFTLADGTILPAPGLIDGKYDGFAELPLGAEGAEVAITFPSAVTIRSIAFHMPGMKLPFRGARLRANLEMRGQGGWRHLAELVINQVPTTQAIGPVTGREFRLRLAVNDDTAYLARIEGAPGAVAVNFLATAPLTRVWLAELHLSAEDRIDRAEEKAGYEIVPEYQAIASAGAAAAEFGPAQVIDLTDRVRPDGTLDWTPPRGHDWRILWFGWSLTGKTNHPATPEATGLEVDKFDGPAVRRYLENYLALYREAVGEDLIGERGLSAIVTDSIEVGKANWTKAMEAEFAARRGYALRPWLPALAGFPVGSRGETERFLFDYRQTLAELLSDRHYATLAQVAHEQGLTVYGEALESGRPMLGDDLAMRAHADVPMAAIWTWAKGRSARTALLGDMRGAASVAHVYGRRFVAAESLTSVNAPWDFAPGELKPVIDLAFASGINRPVIHSSVHQPRDDMQPGLSLAMFGQYFNRHESWASMARPWVDYLARSAYLLQQGRNVADIAWFIGEDSPVTALFADQIPPGLPSAHAYDFVDARMLADAFAVRGRDLVTSGGARYRAIYLGGTSRWMTLPTLRRLAQLVRAGATLIGTRPVATPSLADDEAAFSRLADALWSGDTGSGRIIATTNIDAALAEAAIAPGFRFEGGGPAARIPFVEREFPGGRLFFLSNPGSHVQMISARFRSTGKRPEYWNAETGTARPLGYRFEGQETVVPLALGPGDAVFILFREDAVLPAQDVSPVVPVESSELAGPWIVSFQPGRGAPAQVTMDRLAPLEENAAPGIRYFSGIARYALRFPAPPGWKPGQPLWLDLGEVHDLAEIRVNGSRAGGLWRAPWRIDIGTLARSGSNDLEVLVANKWVNRLIGDAQPGATKIAAIAAPGYLPDASLRPSGLVGPVKLLTRQR